MHRNTPVAVLIVNDRPDALAALAAVLQPLPVRLLTASSAEDGLRLARDNAVAVAVVDICMPAIDGFAMVERLRADPKMRSLPVIFVSALDTSPQTLERVYSLGAADFVALPARDFELRSKVAVFVDLYEQRSELANRNRILSREATAAVQEQRERFRLFMETASDYAIFFMDVDGTVTEWPTSAENVLGFTAADMVGNDASIIFLQADRDSGVPEHELVDAAINTQAHDERWHQKKDGTLIYAMGRVIALRDESGKVRGFVKILRDATAAKQAEAELHEALDRFESLAESMAQLAWMADPTGARVWFNRRWIEYTGGTFEEMKGWGFAKVYHPDDRDTVLERIRRGFASGKPWSAEWRIRGCDGQYRWFLTQVAPVAGASGQTVRWFGTNTDIHAQVLLREELKASEQKFREIFETANEGIWILDVNGRVEIANKRMAEMLGYSVPELVGKAKVDFIFPEDVEYIRQLFEDRRRGQISIVEVRFRRKDGQPIWTLLSARPLFRDGKFAGALDMFTDISARKTAAEAFAHELKKQVAERTAALQEKTNQLESFTYTIAHDLRSPLRAISGYAEFTLEDFRDRLPDEAISNLDKIKASAARLDALIRDLLSYTRVAQVEFVEEDVPLRAPVDWALEQLRHEIEASGARIDVAPRLPSVRGERSILDQVLLNLTSNALKFVAPGVAPHVKIDAAIADGIVRLTVTDNGVGVPHEYHDRIFRVFERLQGSHRFPGTGVGLAIVARAAERLGGRAGVESEPGHGSTFWVELRKGES